MLLSGFRNSISSWGLVVAVSLIVLSGCNRKKPPAAVASKTKSGTPNQVDKFAGLTDSQTQIKTTMLSEDLLQSLAVQMSLLNRSLQHRETDLSSVVQTELAYRGIEEFDLEHALSTKPKQPELAAHFEWPIATTETAKNILASELWAPLLENYVFESCQFGTVDTRFVDGDFQADTKFEGRFRTQDSRLVGIKAHQTLQWTEVAPDDWRINKWIQDDFHVQVTEAPLFEDVTAKVIPDPETLKKVQNSSHEAKILHSVNNSGRTLKPPSKKFEDFADWESAYQYPGVSVVDIDQDGFDDLFVTDRWQSAQLLRNRGDGTFEDITEASGLKVEELVCCSFFADFDNDGDSDLFVGGTLESSKYFENVNGVFKVDEELQAEYADMLLVVSGSVIDVNGDGLLDVYLNTYGFGTAWRGDANKAWSDTIIRVEDRVKMRLKIERSHWYVDRGGAPNILLLNHGGKLKRAKIDDTLAQWRNSYQTVWSDYDDDGDQDLYICNDFAPDFFLRNDTERGSYEAKFTEVTEELVPGGTMGFGMGANWGDYNNNGLLDLYVSNMYSKAGNRIVSKFDNVDERVKVSARGNFLYENQGGQFKQVAGLGGDDQHVSKVGWSFGGQFADFDNDGNLDVYVPSGFFTPPQEVQKSGDW